MPSSFPISPSNGAKYTVGGTRYTYVSSLNRWTVDTSISNRTPTIHIFTSSTTWTVPANVQAIEAIVIGAGGGGGGGGYLQKGASGGGGGGLSIARYNLNYFNSGTSSISCYITIGAGGAGGTGRITSGSSATNGSNGGNTSISFGATNIGRVIAGGGFGGLASTGSTGDATALVGGAGGKGMWNGGQGGSGGYGTTSTTLAGSNASDTINTPTGGGGAGGTYTGGIQGTGGSSGSGAGANISVFDLQPTLTTPITLSSTYTDYITGVDLYSPANSLLNNFYPVTGPGTGGSGAPANGIDSGVTSNAFYGGAGGLYGGGGGGGGSIIGYPTVGYGGNGGDGAQGCVILTVFYGLGGA
jgi:hypothetical protein